MLLVDDFPVGVVVLAEYDGESGLVSGDGVDTAGNPYDLLQTFSVCAFDIPGITVWLSGHCRVKGDGCARTKCSCFLLAIATQVLGLPRVPCHL